MTSYPSPIRLLIADDHPVVREGLCGLVARMPDMVVAAQAADGVEAVERYFECRPDVTLMDLRMPHLSGPGAISRIRGRAPRARVIVLTTYDTDHQIYEALKSGARAYLLKDTSRDQLLETIRLVHSGQQCIPPAVAQRLVERLSYPELTPREAEVLDLMCQGRSNQAIGRALFISEGTVKAHVNHIFQKLGAEDRTQAVTTALRRGLASTDSSPRA